MMTEALPHYIETTEDLYKALHSFLKKNSYSMVFSLVDENTKLHCYPLLSSLLKEKTTIEIKSGEEHKTLSTCTLIWSMLTKKKADRKALLINLGGGVIGDIGGFCASCYKRGIDFINIPTTLLAQVDASIGGKVGVDFGGLKNHIGLFSLPKKVIISPTFLKTLPQLHINSGVAEMLKYGFIKDKNYLKELSSLNRKDSQWFSLIKKSIAIKNEIVCADPFEKNLRKLLNFGHTIGHAVESYFIAKGRPITHGQAVAVGMIAEGYLSSKILNFKEEERKSLIQLISTYFKKIDIPESSFDEIFENLTHDKKNEKNQLQAVMLSKLGEAHHSIPVSKKEIFEALKFYALLA